MTSAALAGNTQHGGHNTAEVAAACAGAQSLPSLACARAPSAGFDRQGRLWLAWAYGGHVYVNYSDDKGKTYSSPVVVNRVPEPIAARGENRPKIAVDQKGKLFVSWTQRLKKRFSGHVRFSRSLDNGQSFSTPITVNDHLEETSHRFDVLGVNDEGNVYLAWLDKRDKLAAKKKGQAYRGAAVYYAISSDGGDTFQRNRKIIDHSCECCRVAMAMDVDQLPVILWRHIFGKNTRDHALVKFTERLQTGEVVRVSYDQWQVDACPHHGPAISIGKDGVYHLVWFNNAPQRHGLFYTYSTDQGRSFNQPVNFGNYQKGASHPQVLAKGKNVYLGWKEFDGKQSLLYVMQSVNAGKSWAAPRQLDQSSAASDHPLLLSDGKGVFVAWHLSGVGYRVLPVSESPVN